MTDTPTPLVQQIGAVRMRVKDTDRVMREGNLADVRWAILMEHMATTALLAVLDGVPERLAALELVNERAVNVWTGAFGCMADAGQLLDLGRALLAAGSLVKR